MPEGLVAYAVLPAGHAPPAGLCGPGGAPIRVLEAEGLALWVSSHDHAPAPGVDTARAHHDVVGAALADGVTPVPLRFGQWLASEARALQALRERAPEWRAALARLEGCVEVGVRARAPDGGAAHSVHPRTDAGGTEYLLALARKHAAARASAERAEALAATLSAAGAPWIRDAKVEVLRDPPGGLSVAYLVDTTEASFLQNALESAAREHAAPGFAVTGPWPPYSFT